VWWAAPSFAGPDHVALLDPAERERDAALRRAEDRARFRTGSALIRLAVARYLGTAPADVAIDRSCVHCDRPHGKPRVGGGLEVSVSHSGDLVALAVTRGHAVGVDVEQGRSTVDYRELAATVLAPIEAEWLATVDDGALPAAFLRYWTRKEAIVKATGEGLRTPLASVVVTPPDAPPAALHAGGIELFDLHPDDGYAAAVAVLGPPGWQVTELPPLA